MLRSTTFFVLATLICFTNGCRLDSETLPPAPSNESSGVDENPEVLQKIARQVGQTRAEYLYTMKLLVHFYQRLGHSQKLKPVRKEMSELQSARIMVNETGKVTYSTQTPVDITRVSESQLADRLTLVRGEYLRAVQLAIDYYTEQADERNLQRAQKEVGQLQYVQMLNPLGMVLPDATLAAKMVNPGADAMFMAAQRKYTAATKFILIKKKKTLAEAARLYQEMIDTYPSSDKIDNAAFYLGVIYQELGLYEIAATYYQRAYQWDPRTPHPARFKAAYLLDEELRRRHEALELYKKAINSEGIRHPAWREHAQERVTELSDSPSVS